jgi:N-methylhydantoinase B/oxoprolinase/acetone carboxylase alpha subunit
VGGSRHGSFCSDATECYQEGLQLPPTKLVEGGEIRSDIWNLILSHTRAAAAFTLDLRGLVGANNTTVRAMTQLADRFGVATVRNVMAGLIELSDGRMRQRLRSLPDATVWSTASLDNGRERDGIYDVSLTLTKSGETLTFDYSESSLQPPGVVNCTVSGLMSGINAALLPSLASDAPWNEGLLHPVEVVCPEVRIGDAAEPVVGGGAQEAGSLVEMTAVEALSKLLTCSDELMGGAQALLARGPDRFVMSGIDAHGVIATIHESGGGWGDPLSRPVAELRRDLTDGTVGQDAAIRFYGAVLTGDGKIDAEATACRRAELLAERRQWPVARQPVDVPEGSVRISPLGDGLELVEAPCGLRLIRCACGQGLCRSDQPWREHAASQVGADLHEVSMATRLSNELELRWYACPRCGVLLALDVARTASPAMHDVELN